LTAPEVPMGESSEDSTTSTPALRASGRSWSNASGRYMVDSTTSVNPPAASWRRVWSRNGSLANGISGLGRVLVSGRRRVPKPPARITACTWTIS
jgi:hypothetical protein